MYIVQQRFGLADGAPEHALLDSHLILAIIRSDLGREGAPDATTLLHFRRLLEMHDLSLTI